MHFGCLFGQEFPAETAEATSALATKILDAATETADNAARYSMLKLAADSEIVKKSIDLMDRF